MAVANYPNDNPNRPVRQACALAGFQQTFGFGEELCAYLQAAGPLVVVSRHARSIACFSSHMTDLNPMLTQSPLAGQTDSLPALFRFFVAGLLLAIPAASVSTSAQQNTDRFAFDPLLTYDAAIPSPEEVLGFELGEAYTPYHQLVSYLRQVADASDRVTMHRYGATHEGRPLHYLVITSVDNQARIEAIRENNLRLATGEALSDTEARELIETQPAVSWLSYNVHGNEASSSETAMQVVYRLAAAGDAVTRAILESSIVIIDPCMNPDGRERYVSWYRSVKSSQLNDDANDLEHDEPWPGGRTNHYWFDLNRDWVWLVHPSSEARVAAYQRWLPQMHTDYHEQGYNNNYFTMPGQPPRNLLLPDAYVSWADRFGRANAAAFDTHHIAYFTRESFDFFYPGYGSSYPSLMGGIGMLTEQGGHSRGARAVETEDGYVLTLRQRIFDHYLTSFAALETVADQREELLRYFRSAFLQSSNKSETKAYLLSDNPDDLTRHVVSILLKHGVAVYRTDAPFEEREAYSFETGEAGPRAFPEGTFVIPADQPRHLFVNTILARNMAIEDSVMYDMATWSAPLAYDLDAAWVTSKPGVSVSRLNEVPESTGELLGDSESAYAYVIDWRDWKTPSALAMLWEAGYRVRSVRKPFTVDGRTYARGSLVVLVGRNLEKQAEMAGDLGRIARTAGVQIVALPSGRVDDGIDLVSPNSRPLARPKVGLLVGSPFSSYTAGQIWYLFDKWTGFGISRLRRDALARLDLSEYDVLVLPGAYEAPFDSMETVRLDAWIRNGGTLVATEGSALSIAEGGLGLRDVALVKEAQPHEADETEKPKPPPSAYTPYAARRDSAGLNRIPGSAFLGHLDTTHPLSFGLSERLYTLRFSSTAFMPSDGWQTVGYYDKDPDRLLVAGYARRAHLERLAGMAFAGVESIGRGQVVLLADNTQYRMFWIGPSRLMQNAVLLMPGM